MFVTMELVKNYYKVDVGGRSLCNITVATGLDKVEVFKKLCEDNVTELYRLVRARDIKRNFNHDHPSKAKDWPEFRNCERFLEKLLKEARIKDT